MAVFDYTFPVSNCYKFDLTIILFSNLCAFVMYPFTNDGLPDTSRVAPGDHVGEVLFGAAARLQFVRNGLVTLPPRTFDVRVIAG